MSEARLPWRGRGSFCEIWNLGNFESGEYENYQHIMTCATALIWMRLDNVQQDEPGIPKREDWKNRQNCFYTRIAVFWELILLIIRTVLPVYPLCLLRLPHVRGYGIARVSNKLKICVHFHITRCMWYRWIYLWMAFKEYTPWFKIWINKFKTRSCLITDRITFSLCFLWRSSRTWCRPAPYQVQVLSKRPL